MKSLRQRCGALLLDVPRVLQKTRRGDQWVTYTNRLGSYERKARPERVRVLSDQTASLHVTDVFPWTGKRLLRSAIAQWKFDWKRETVACSNPLISVLIPVRGPERLSLLKATIASLNAMTLPMEIIVIEQDETPRLGALPSHVRYLHAPHPKGDTRWHKCFAYNRGAEFARGAILILHDGDVVVPVGYDRAIKRHLVEEGLDVFYPGRFLFYLDQRCTEEMIQTESFSHAARWTPESVKENWTGGTLAIRREAYDRIGGFDESFTGWTGEDREFYDRCQILDGMFHSYLPFLHLWHAAQDGKDSLELRRQAAAFTTQKLSIDRLKRIKSLHAQRAEE